ncbi:MAG TPA: NnrU family protein [Alphaproteobacteria bacterium]|nr:NnrU family protein [Alphaproteobacteria bacterium]
MTNLALAVLAFVGGHFLLSSGPVRGPVATRLGETAFSGAYSALMLATFVWMVGAFRAAPYVPLWSVAPAARMIPVLVMPFACLLLVGSLTVRNPTMVMQSVAASGDPAPGLVKVTRHPMLWAFALWALAHLIVNGEVAALLLFGGIAVLALAGTVAIDAKRRARDPDAFARLASKTSNLPLAALIAGRTTIGFGDFGWWRLGLTALLYVALIAVHPYISGRTLM